MSLFTARAYAIQGLIKYHGMKDKVNRLPYHDSISVCIEQAKTVTTVKLIPHDLERDIFFLGDEPAQGREYERVESVINKVREISGRKEKVLGRSKNFIQEEPFTYQRGKGIGYSASAGAALALATLSAFGVKDYLSDYKKISTIARLESGSAARSTAGGFAKWITADRPEDSWATQIARKRDLPNYRMIIYPIPKSVKTETAHEEAELSPLFKGRLEYLEKAVPAMETAIRNKNVSEMARIAEVDSLNLHATTMTGKNGMVNWEPDSIKIYHKIKELRESDPNLIAYVSWDTGPTTFINTVREYESKIIKALDEVVKVKPVVSGVGERVELIDEHLRLDN